MKTNMDYSRADEWIIGENRFAPNLLGKSEAIMCLGNGYMGLRSAAEEGYLGETRNLFVAGTFNRFDDNEVTELPNCADVTQMEFKLNGVRFDLTQGTIKSYYKSLNLKNGELERTITWQSPDGNEYKLLFKRMVSMKRLHVIAQYVEITPLTGNVEMELASGINGRMTNSGSQHFTEGGKRFIDKKYMRYHQQTAQSKIDFTLHTHHRFRTNGGLLTPECHIVMERRIIRCEYQLALKQNETLCVEKISNVHTSRDKDSEGLSLTQLEEKAFDEIGQCAAQGYQALLSESAAVWEEQVWNAVPVTIQSSQPLDQLAIRFSQYHMYVMTPAHDNRMHVAAKGLSGEGYKGHTFWDTEIFILPYFTFTAPEIARGLLEYRYLSLSGAHKKAAENGFEGAQFPWESAWLDDGEVTPVWGSADIVTGLSTKIWSGFIELHITADIAFAIWQYYNVAGDCDFMEQYGYELILDTAKFWSSRLEWSDGDEMYHINDVIGPDEYKEHVDDNAFTNYMAHWNIKLAIEYCDLLKSSKPELFKKLDAKLDLRKTYETWCERVQKIYLPSPRKEDMVIPQEKNYLTYEDIDLTKYKNQDCVGSLFRDYNLERVNRMQVSKQADIMILFLLMENLFSQEVKRANWDYYEPRTLHDSSLSLSTHVIIASDFGDKQLAYSLYQKAIRIDMGTNMRSSNDGIHAGSLAGIWQSVVFGFSGVRMLGGKLRINPALPDEWDSVSFYIYWKGQKLFIEITRKALTVTKVSGSEPVELEICGTPQSLVDTITYPLGK